MSEIFFRKVSGPWEDPNKGIGAGYLEGYVLSVAGRPLTPEELASVQQDIIDEIAHAQALPGPVDYGAWVQDHPDGNQRVVGFGTRPLSPITGAQMSQAASVVGPERMFSMDQYLAQLGSRFPQALFVFTDEGPKILP